MKLYLNRIYIFLIVVFSSTLQSQPKATIETFNQSDYPDSVFITSSIQYTHGSVIVRLIQVKMISSYDPFICRVWLNIERNGKIVNQYYLNDIEPVGGYYGLFVPSKKPVEEYFAVIKYGDYDGRLFLIDKSGKMTQYMGGSYLVSHNKGMLFSEYSSDLKGVEVVDLRNGVSICRSTNLPLVQKWYYNNIGGDEKYFFTSDDVIDSIYVFNSKTNLISSKPIDSLLIKRSVILKYNFEPPDDIMCGCKYK